MRRKDREITGPELIRRYIHQCEICRIGFNDDGEVYIVPLNFGISGENGSYIFYFHGAKEGRKLDLIRKNPAVGFEMDCHYALTAGEKGHDCTARFRSIIGNGTMSLVESREEKIFGLNAIMGHYTEKNDWTFDEKMLNATCVFKLTVEKLSCKASTDLIKKD